MINFIRHLVHSRRRISARSGQHCIRHNRRSDLSIASDGISRTEQLEDRTLLTVTAGFTETFGLLIIEATDDGDVVLVEHDGSTILVNSTPVPASDTGETATLANVTQINVRGDADVDEANDFRILSDFTGVSVVVQSGGGDDTLVGGNGPELFLGQGGNNDIRGGGGDDTILAGDGDDTLVGDSGNDSIAGGFGNDQLFGELGDDTLNGGNGNDTLLGRDGADELFGESGNDLLFGESGNDTLIGGTGDDGFAFPGSSLGSDSVIDTGGEDFLDFGLLGNAVNIDLRSTSAQTVSSGDLVLTLNSGTAFEIVVGSEFDDTLIGNSADNFLFGNDGDDDIFGSSGNDFLFGQLGNDTLAGEAGLDTLNAGAGNDDLEGGSDSDTYIFDASAAGNDTLLDQPSEAPNTDQDVLDFSAFTTAIDLDLGSTMPQSSGPLTLQLVSSVSIENVIGTTDNDTVTGNAADNELLGGAGDDELNGADGNDTLFGEAGNDDLSGGNDDDSLEGNAGEDLLAGDDGDDFLKGGSSSDTYSFAASAGGTDTIRDQDSEAPGTDHDRLSFESLATAVNVDLSLTSAQMVTPGISLILATSGTVEDVLGGSGNDTLAGNAFDNLLLGGGGNDFLSGAEGNDTLQGVAGSDTLIGGADDDSLQGQSGDDLYAFEAGWGGDTVVELGADGADTMTFATIGTPLQITIGSVEVQDTNGNLVTHSGNDIEHVIGGQGGNLVVFQDAAALANGFGTITGGVGTDTLDYTNYTSAIQLELGTPSTTGLGGFSQFESVIGGQSDQDEIVGDNDANLFQISGIDSGFVNDELSFSAIENLTGSAGDDTFLFEGLMGFDEGLSGIADGNGGHDIFDFSLLLKSVNVFLSGSVGNDHVGGFQSIEHFIAPELGPGVFDFLFGDDLSAAWHLTAGEEGTVTTSAQVVSFTGFETIGGGNLNDVFFIDDGVDEIGSISGGFGNDTIDLSAYQADINIDGAEEVNNSSVSPSESIARIVSSFETYIGGQGANTAEAPINGGTLWTITGDDQFTNQNRDSGPVTTFVNFGFIKGGSKRDDFIIMPGGSLSGGIDGDFIDINTGPIDPDTDFIDIELTVMNDTGIDLLDYSAFTSAVFVDLVNETATGIPSLTGINVVRGGSGNDTLIGVEKELGVSLLGGDGDDTLTGESGDFAFQGGNGDDEFILSPDGAVLVDDTSGRDRLDFRNADLAIQLAVDERSIQTINSRGDTLNLRDEFEDVIGTEFADTITAGPLGTSRFLDGRNPAGPGEGDTLIFDAGGAVITGTTSNSISTAGFADVTHARFESVVIQNAGTTDGTNTTVTENENGDLTVTDTGGNNTDLTVAISNNVATFESGSGLFEIGDEIDVDAFEPPSGYTRFFGNGASSTFNISTGAGDDDLSVDFSLFTSDVPVVVDYDGGDGVDDLSIVADTSTMYHIFISNNSGEVYVATDSAPPLVEFVTGSVSGPPPEDLTLDFPTVVSYQSLESVDMRDVNTTHLIFKFPDTDNSAVIEPGANPGEFRLRSMNNTFVTTELVAPAGGIHILGGAGNDMIDASAIDFHVGLFGGDGNDLLIGGSAADSLFGGAGDDALVGNSGSDFIKGDAGIDTLNGGSGDDTLNGGAQNDSILGGDDRDTLFGGAGADLLDGGAGNDRLSGQGGSGDTLDGGDGDDFLNGGSGIDFVRVSVNADITLQNSLSTGDGTDTLQQLERAILYGGFSTNLIDASAFDGPVLAFGRSGSDTLIGGSSNDTLIGGAGHDELRGGDGDDTLRGSAGRDTLEGGNGNDRLFGQGGSRDRLDGGAGNDTLDGGAGIDILVATADVNFVLSDTQLIGEGIDTLRRIEQAELSGGVSANSINAASFTGITRLNGQGGDDTITGGSTDDVIAGGAGSDSLIGGPGNDKLLGQGSSGDILFGDAGSDTLDGGSGIDTIMTDVLDSVIVDVLDVVIEI